MQIFLTDQCGKPLVGDLVGVQRVQAITVAARIQHHGITEIALELELVLGTTAIQVSIPVILLYGATFNFELQLL